MEDASAGELADVVGFVEQCELQHRAHGPTRHVGAAGPVIQIVGSRAQQPRVELRAGGREGGDQARAADLGGDALGSAADGEAGIERRSRHPEGAQQRTPVPRDVPEDPQRRMVAAHPAREIVVAEASDRGDDETMVQGEELGGIHPATLVGAGAGASAADGAGDGEGPTTSS